MRSTLLRKHLLLVSLPSNISFDPRKKKDAADRRPRYEFKPRTLYQMTGQPNPNKNLQLDSNTNGSKNGGRQ